MKNLISVNLIVLCLFTSCSKRHTASPQLNVSSSIAEQPAAADNIAASAAVAPVAFNVPQQEASLTRDNSTLKLAYLQRIALLADAETLNHTYSITFTQDLSASALRDFDFVNIAIAGNQTTNWATMNLNEVNKSTKDTLVNGIKLVKIYFERKFNFSKSYSSEAEAITQANVLKQLPQAINFTVYYQPQADTTRRNRFSIKLKITGPTQ